MTTVLTPAPRPWVRAVVAGVVAVGLALAAHTSVNGSVPSPRVLLATVVVTAVLARLLTAVEVRLPVLLAGLTLVQLGLHAAFLHLSAGGGSRSGVAGWLCCGDVRPIPAGSVTTVDGVGLSRRALVLLASHLIAVALTALWLRRCEANVWEAARQGVAVARQAIASRLRVLVTAIARIIPTVGALSRPCWPQVKVPSSVLLTTRVSRRGPPLMARS